MDILEKALVIVPPLFLAMVLHEVAHGYVAYKLGDSTAKSRGRLSLNPIVHIDLYMTILLPAFLIFVGSPVVFGAAKPVPVNPMHFKNPLRGMLWVAIAGPLVNFFLAILSFLAVVLVANTDTAAMTLVSNWLVYSVLINIVLGLFNLMPVPPLDGGRILVGILPQNLAVKVMQLERWGFAIVIALIFLKVPQYFIGPVLEFVLNLLGQI